MFSLSLDSDSGVKLCSPNYLKSWANFWTWIRLDKTPFFHPWHLPWPLCQALQNLQADLAIQPKAITPQIRTPLTLNSRAGAQSTIAVVSPTLGITWSGRVPPSAPPCSTQAGMACTRWHRQIFHRYLSSSKRALLCNLAPRTLGQGTRHSRHRHWQQGFGPHLRIESHCPAGC